MTWDEFAKLYEAERAPSAVLRARYEGTNRSEIALQWARACVREGKYMEALEAYSVVESYGDNSVEAERNLVGQRVGGDSPDGCFA